MQVKIPTSILNRFLEDVIGRNPPPAQGTKRLKIFYGAMVQMPPPRIKLFVNDKKLCKAHYRQFLSNQIRDAFYPETGLPIILEVRGRREGDEKNDGRRRAAAGAKREQQTADRAKDRHRERRKGWRKKGQ
jgi:predicted GTPase